MSREIKFRYRIKQDGIGELFTFCLDIEDVEKIHSLKGSKDVILTRDQYTGLKDKNGKGVYEGDILRDDCGELHKVTFGKLPLDKSGDCVCTYEAFYCKCYGKLGQAPFYECTKIGDWMEIIGNIYEDGHLLEGT